MRNSINHIARSVINSYAILFFSQNEVFGVILLLVSFLNRTAGMAGLLGTLFAITYTTIAGYSRQDIQKGLFSFNALLFGIGLGSFYHINTAFFIWLIVGCFVTILITNNLSAWLKDHKLPYLSLPFIISFWILLSAANSIFQMGLLQKNSAVINELGASVIHTGSFFTATYYKYYISLYCRALSAVLFQNNAFTGLFIGLGIFIHSRIAFSISFLAFITACVFNAVSNTYPEGISYYHLGSNIMMTAMATGSFFLIPSFRSYLWAMVTVPVIFLLINALTRLIGVHDLPVLSLPFCILTLMLLHFFRNRNQNKLALTVLQYYSPEKNLYQYLNGEERLSGFKYFDIKLPFMGTWYVSQAYNGDITHKGDWGQALDFVIKDDYRKTYKLPGTRPEHFYCFNKPVLACGNGVVDELIDHIDDNEIGAVNTKDNWGNSIVIRHTNGLFSKVSHLKKGSAKVKTGDFVKQGDIIGLCGNSGRSPEPHLHFQLQTTPYIGSKTLAYPFSYYVSETAGQTAFNAYAIPAEGMSVRSLAVNASLKSAFSFQPGSIKTLQSSDGREETVEVQTDAFNQTYIYSTKTNSYAYFINNGTAFYFTSFYGSKNSLLYFFYLAAYKVVFTDDPNNHVLDTYPLQLFPGQPIRWLNDMIAPFKQFIRLTYQNNIHTDNGKISIQGKQYKTVFVKQQQTMDSAIQVEQGEIQGLRINLNGNYTEVTWTAKNIY